MSRGLYLKPLAFLYGEPAEAAVAAGEAAFLAAGPVAFSRVEMIEGPAGSARRHMRAFRDLAATRETAVTRLLACMTTPRASLAGLAMDRPRIMGVVNVTPDSFSDGGRLADTAAAIAHAGRLVADGADIVDVGGESTRPGAEPLEASRELARVLPVLEGVRGLPARLSVDTRKAEVMTAAAEAGAHILNDVSALTFDPAAMAVAAACRLPVVLMHAQGDPRTMQDDPRYDDVLLEVYDYLEERIATCEAAGIGRDRLIADPGIGFGKTLAHNLTLLAGIGLYHGLGVPLLLGASRKRFIGTLAGAPDPMAREPGSLAAALAAAAQGVQILRVHDVGAMRQALVVWNAAVAGRSM